MFNELIKEIDNSFDAKKSLLEQFDLIDKSVKKISSSIKNGKKIFFCGNGGSAADAQHLAAELLVRLRPRVNRKSIPSISLAMDTSAITACANDYSFEEIFSRPLSSLGANGDILIAITTSGKSKNILKALKVAKKKNILTIGFLGCDGGQAKKNCDIPIIVKSTVTARIQETHIFLGHFIIEKVEDTLIKKNII
jgi:D-sedoheptulose 7-phosphate isomerase